MTLTFNDLQEMSNPANGSVLASVEEVKNLFQSLRNRHPFMFELHSSNGFMLTIGIAPECGTVQYSSSKGVPPYWMAMSNETEDESEFVEFLVGNTPTPISRRYCLSIEQVLLIASDFLKQGNMSHAAIWEEV